MKLETAPAIAVSRFDVEDEALAAWGAYHQHMHDLKRRSRFRQTGFAVKPGGKEASLVIVEDIAFGTYLEALKPGSAAAACLRALGKVLDAAANDRFELVLRSFCAGAVTPIHTDWAYARRAVVPTTGRSLLHEYRLREGNELGYAQRYMTTQVETVADHMLQPGRVAVLYNTSTPIIHQGEALTDRFAAVATIVTD